MKNHMQSKFKMIGYNVHKKIRISCGLPSSRAFGAGSRTIGQCWDNSVSSDKHNEIFISPTISDSIDVAAVLAHEIVHAVVGVVAGHKKPFRDCAVKLGLEGKMTATSCGSELKAFIEEKIIDIGEYPHAALNYSKRKKQSTRMIKVVCPNKFCAHKRREKRQYSVRLSAKTLDYGSPKCGSCSEYMLTEEQYVTYHHEQQNELFESYRKENYGS